MGFADAKTYNDLLALFVALNNKVARLRSLLNLPDSDARHVALRGIQGVLAGYFMGLHSMVFARSKDQVLRSLGESNLSPDEARKTVEDAWRLGLLTLCHFKIDVLFHNLLRVLGRTPPMSFSGKSRDLIELLALSNQATIEAVLHALTYTRNSLHNNGIHRHRSVTFHIGGMSYEFVQNAAVQCATWQHILCALDAACDAMESILLSPVISGLSSGIVDDFATEVLAGRAEE
jgi:hypothetical protein